MSELYVEDILNTDQVVPEFDVFTSTLHVARFAIEKQLGGEVNGITVKTNIQPEVPKETINGLPLDQDRSCRIKVPKWALEALLTTDTSLTPNEKSMILAGVDDTESLEYAFSDGKYLTVQNAPDMPPQEWDPRLIIEFKLDPFHDDDKPFRYCILPYDTIPARELPALTYATQQIGISVAQLASRN